MKQQRETPWRKRPIDRRPRQDRQGACSTRVHRPVSQSMNVLARVMLASKVHRRWRAGRSTPSVSDKPLRRARSFPSERSIVAPHRSPIATRRRHTCAFDRQASWRSELCSDHSEQRGHRQCIESRGAVVEHACAKRTMTSVFQLAIATQIVFATPTDYRRREPDRCIERKHVFEAQTQRSLRRARVP